MKTLAQEIGALVMNLCAKEFETTEQFSERIGRVVLEKIAQSIERENFIRHGSGATLDPSVIARRIVTKIPRDAPQFVVVCETAEPDSEVTACYGPFASRADALEFKERSKFGEDIFPATYPLRRIL
jgi:hypothetical protein